MTKEDFKEVVDFVNHLNPKYCEDFLDKIYADFMNEKHLKNEHPKYKSQDRFMKFKSGDRVILCFDDKVFEYTIKDYICHIEEEAFYYAECSRRKTTLKIGEHGLSLKKDYSALWKEKYPKKAITFGSTYPSAWKPEAFYDGEDWVVQYPPYFFELYKKTTNG